MSSFLDIALPLAERGFRVFPLIPGKKQPFAMAGEADHFDAATTDPQQIESWNAQEPNANVGLSPDEIFCFLETDSEAELKQACADLPPEVWDTARVSAREDRCYYIFRQTMRTKRAGNQTKTRKGQENLFEFKQHRALVTGPGSIHPKTGLPYLVEWRTIPAMPDILLNRICELAGAPKTGNTGTMSEDVKTQTALLDSFLETYEVAATGDWFNKGKSWYRPIVCPWADEHENTNAGTSTCVVYTEGGGYGFDCKHRCADKSWQEFRAELKDRFPDKTFSFVHAEGTPEVAFSGTALPIIAHATLAEAFLRDNHDFVCVYDLEKRPIAQWVKTRWDISGDDTLLWRAVSDYLKGLFDQYKEPEKGPDSRKRFYDASFITGVVRCVKPYLPPIKAEVFDQNPYMLGLPDCRVIDLRTSAVREMRRDDYISQRIDVSPDPNCSTPRFDRFITEITCGDGALANYVLRLCALCLTATPFQALFFLWGRGRNGKGVLIRTLTAILGDGKFAWPLRPSEITVSKFGDEAMKRTFANLKGKRLVTVNESVSGNLNVSMLKLMSGGDALSGARMRQDQEVFKPTHKVLLPTNDRPQLPADPAFRGRVHMIPFAANFTGREDRSLDHTLQHVELPGILHRLLTLCPDVIENGLRPPASVLAETDQLFSELDWTKQFMDDCIEVVHGAETSALEMEKAVSEWLSSQNVSAGHSQNTLGFSYSVSGFDTKMGLILHELRRLPDVKYARVRRDSDRADGKGQGRAWVYVGIRLKLSSVSTS
jgi:P4 family phage/plasmid primase-like protien